VSALHGEIEEGVLANLLQYLSLSQATGCLTLRHPDRLQGNVFVERGRVVFVDARPQYDLAALASLLQWCEGRFSFRPGVSAPRRTLTNSTESLLLEASHQADQEARLEEPSLVGADTVLQARPLDRGESTVAVSLPALRLWRHLDGTSSVRDIAREAGASLDRAVEAAAELMRQGLVDFATVPMVDASFVDALARAAVDIIGPVGQIVVEDALYDLGLSEDAIAESAVDELILELAAQFRRSEWQLDFLRRAERLRQRYGLGA